MSFVIFSATTDNLRNNLQVNPREFLPHNLQDNHPDSLPHSLLDSHSAGPPHTLLDNLVDVLHIAPQYSQLASLPANLAGRQANDDDDDDDCFHRYMSESI